MNGSRHGPINGAAAATPGPGYRATVWALALGQVLSWAVLYDAFSSLVLPMDSALGWGQPALMGAFTLGLAVWGAATYAVGAAMAATLYEPAFAVLTQRCPTRDREAITTLMLVLAASGVVAVVVFWAARPPGRSRNDVAG